MLYSATNQSAKNNKKVMAEITNNGIAGEIGMKESFGFFYEYEKNWAGHYYSDDVGGHYIKAQSIFMKQHWITCLNTIN